MPVPETEAVFQIEGAEASRHILRPGEYVLGKAVDADLRVEANLVSPRHARLTIQSDQTLVEDLGSESGTFINGSAVTRPTRVWPGQKIRLGAATVELRRLRGTGDLDATITPEAAAIRRLLPALSQHDRRYEIGGQIAQGGMGAILNAKEVAIRREVAMKVMLKSGAGEDLVRFVEEAQITGQLEHPNIVPVHELSVDENDQVFYTMKMVKGITLRKVLELLAQGVRKTVEKYPLPALLTIFQKLCDAVAFAHSRSVIHRDLKPENIMLGGFGEVLVMDWGLAKQMRSTERGTRNEAGGAAVAPAFPVPRSEFETTAGTILGTPQYMAPEQARGEVESLDARADIYALGAILYHILALRVSVAGKSAMEIVGKVGRGEIEPLYAPQSRIPDSLAAVVRKAMALRKEERYATVPELQAEIAAYQAGFATGAENASLWKQAVLLVKRHKGAFATAFVAWAIITALAVWFVMNIAHERDRAEQQRVRAEAGERRAEETLGLANSHLLRVKIEKAREAFDSDRADEGLAWLAAVLRQDPQNRFAPSWIVSALSDRNWALPAAPPIVVERPTDIVSESNTLVRFSPDGKRVFFNSGYQSCGVWEVASGRLVWPKIKRGNVGPGVFSLDGRHLLLRVIGSDGRQVSRLDAETGKLLGKTDPPHVGEIEVLVLSPAGTLIATGDNKGEIRVWDAHTLAPLGEAFRGPGQVLSLAISADDRWLAARCRDGQSTSYDVHAWDLRTRQPALEPLKQTWGDTIRFHPASSVLLVGGTNASNRPLTIDLSDGRRIDAKERHGFGSAHPIFSPDGARFATGGADDRARVWDTHSGAPITPWMQHRGDVRPPQFSPEGLRLLTASDDQTARVWDARTGQPLIEPIRLPGLPLLVGECRFSPDGTRVAMAARRGLLQLWDVREGRALPLQIRRDGSPKSLSFSPDGSRLLVGADKSDVRVFDAGTGAAAMAALMHEKGAEDAVFSPDGKWIATGSFDNTARIWNAATGQPASPPLKHDGAVKAVAFSPDSRLLATGTVDRKVRLWRVESGEPTGAPISAPGKVWRLTFSPDGRMLAVGSEYGTRLIDLPEARMRPIQALSSNMTDLAFDPKGTRLAVATLYDGAQVFDTASGELALPPLPHDNAVATIQFSPDGVRLLTGGVDGIARIWDARTGNPLGLPLRHEAEVYAIFSPDGRRVATTSRDGRVRLWDAESCQPLSDSFRQEAGLERRPVLSPDGNRLAFALNHTIRVWNVPPLPTPAPAWLPVLAETVAGRRVDERGELVSTGTDELWFTRIRLADRGGNDPYARWAAWFFADRTTRAPSPWRAGSVKAEIEQLEKGGGETIRPLVLRYRPEHFRNLLGLGIDLRGRARGQSQLLLEAESLYAASAHVQLLANLAAQRSAGAAAYTTGAGPRGFPRRDPACTAHQLDLTRHYTHLLDVPWHSSDPNTHLAPLLKGAVTLAGIAWDIRGVVQLFGDKAIRAFPVRAEGIPVAQRFTRLHALMATASRSPDGTRVGHFLLRYKDGTGRDLPIVYGEDLRDWQAYSDNADAKNAREAWRGKPGVNTLRLFHRAYENPRPDAEVAALDFVSAKADAGPFVVALTVE